MEHLVDGKQGKPIVFEFKEKASDRISSLLKSRGIVLGQKTSLNPAAREAKSLRALSLPSPVAPQFYKRHSMPMVS